MGGVTVSWKQNGTPPTSLPLSKFTGNFSLVGSALLGRSWPWGQPAISFLVSWIRGPSICLQIQPSHFKEERKKSLSLSFFFRKVPLKSPDVSLVSGLALGCRMFFCSSLKQSFMSYLSFSPLCIHFCFRNLCERERHLNPIPPKCISSPFFPAAQSQCS